MAKQSDADASSVRKDSGNNSTGEQGKTFEGNLEQELYREKPSTRPGRVKKVWGIKRDEAPDSESWEADQLEPVRSLPLGRYFSIALAFFILSVAIFAFVFFYRSIAIRDVRIELSGPTEVGALASQAYTLIVRNGSSLTLEDGAVEIDLGDGAYFTDQPTDRQRTIPIGQLKSGERRELPLPLFFHGRANSVSEVKATFSYLSPKRNQRFSTARSLAVSINRGSFDFQSHFPNQVFVGEPFQTAFRFSNTTDQPYDLTIRVDPPGSFESVSFSPPTAAPLTWHFSALQPNALAEIILIGRFAEAPLNPVFRAIPTITVRGQEFSLEPIPVAVKAIASPVVLRVQSYPENKLAQLDQELTYTVRWQNKSTINLSDTRLKVTLEGPFDLSSVRSDGYLSATDQSLVWDARNQSKLYRIAPGEEGSVSFAIKTIRDFPLSSPTTKNFRLKVRATLETSSIPPEVQVLSQTLAVTAEDDKAIPGNITASPVIRYRDDAISNHGPFPTIAGAHTTLTAHLYIGTVAEDFRNIIIRTKIPIGVQLTGVWGNAFDPTKLSYNSKTGDFTYQLPDLPANLGYGSSPPHDLAFQLEVTPPATSPDQFVILGPATLSAQGAHSQRSFQLTTNPVTLSDVGQ